jgi:MYXO-CTERM domain-containing protein
MAVLLSLAVAGTAAAQTPLTVPPGTPLNTVTGTVVSSSGTEIVVDTSAGRQRYVVDSNSTVPAGLAAGTRVTVNFHRLEGDVLHVATVTTSPRSERMDPGAPAATRDADMPATASPVPAIGLLGLLSLGGAALLRASRRG